MEEFIIESLRECVKEIEKIDDMDATVYFSGNEIKFLLDEIEKRDAQIKALEKEIAENGGLCI